MNMLEVDPKLFITCRLCLDEMGQYQIVPKVQMQIKYCFDIEVLPFDGLPQLLCKKCESILSQYAGIKQIYQEKQSSLKTKLQAKTVTSVLHQQEQQYTEIVSVLQQQQQDTVSSTQQADNDNNANSGETNNLTKEKIILNNSTLSSDKFPSKSNIKKVTKTNMRSKCRFSWKDDYIRQFVCKFCSKFLKERKSMVKHVSNCDLKQRYSGIVKNSFVRLNRIDSNRNLFKSLDHVICRKDRVLRNPTNKDYYFIFTPKLVPKEETSDSSDEDFNVSKKKHKRRRILSKSSTETLVIDQNTTPKSLVNSDNEEEVQVRDKEKKENDIDLVSVEDSDCTSTTSTKTPIYTDIIENSKNDDVLQNIIAMCYNKYIKKCKIGKNDTNDEYILRRKIINMGKKIIQRKGLISTGLIRYMEHKVLDVDWQGKRNSGSNSESSCVQISLRDNINEVSKIQWISLKEVDVGCEQKDFIDIFEEISKKKDKSNYNIAESSNKNTILFETNSRNILDGNISTNLNNRLNASLNLCVDSNVQRNNNITTKNSPNEIERKVQNSVLFIRNSESKILNANPVPNPKQLPVKKFCAPELFSLLATKKNASISPCTEIMSTDNDNIIGNSEDQLSMPIITSTISLAPEFDIENKATDSNDRCTNVSNVETEKTQSQTLPRIKVKPVSELMPENSINRQANQITSLTAWSNKMNQKSFENVAFTQKSPPHYTNIAPMPPGGVSNIPGNLFPNPVNNMTPASSTSGVSNKSNNIQHVMMNTAELPNKKTTSPFRYFQELLMTHNIVLLGSSETVTIPMTCLIKFKLMFQQECIAPLTLCLSLFCNQNTFCIRVKDVKSKLIDISEISANWQWEILKEFKGHVVRKLFENAQKFGPEVYSRTNQFIMLLCSIEFSKI